MHSKLWRNLLQLASAERGALLWIPGLLVATWLAIFGLRMAPGGVSMFTRTTSLRVAVAPWSGGAPAERAAFEAALRHAVDSHGDLSVVDSARVAERIGEVEGATDDAGLLLQAIRPLNPHLALRGVLKSLPGGGFEADLEAWDVHARRTVLATSTRGNDPAGLARALADSLQAAVLLPRRLATAAAATH